MRPTLLAAFVLLLLSGAASPQVQATPSPPSAATPSPPPVLGISYARPSGILGWYEPLTLRSLRGRKVPLRDHTASWAFSPDRAVLAIASCNEVQPGIRFVDARAMRALGDVRLSRYRGCASALTWLRGDRLVAVVTTSVWDGAEVVLVDTRARRVLRRSPSSSAAARPLRGQATSSSCCSRPLAPSHLPGWP